MVIVNRAPFAVILLMSTLHVKIVDSMQDEQGSLSRSPSPQRKAQMTRDLIKYQLSVRDKRQKVRAAVEKDPCVDAYYPWGAQKEAARQGCREAVEAYKKLPAKDKMGCANPGDASCQLIYSSNVCTVMCDLPVDKQEPGCCLGFCPPILQTPTPLGALVSDFDEDPPSLDELARKWGVSRSSSFSNGGSGSPSRTTGSPHRGNRRRSPTRRQPDRIPTTGEGNINEQATEFIKTHPHPQPNGEPRWSPPKDRPRPERRVTPGDSDIDRLAGEFIHHVHDEQDGNGVNIEFRHSDDRQYAKVESDVNKKAAGYIDKIRNNFAKQKTGSILRRSSTSLFKGIAKAFSLPRLGSKRAKADQGSSYGG